MPHPLVTAISPGPVAAPASIARALAQSLLPEEDPASPPGWLLPGQHRSFRRLLAALRKYRGALLADPVGSGKTYVALAVAAALNRRTTTACLVPATLVAQWRTVAARLGIAVEVASHERASRGRLPPGTGGLVIVDESHHFRNPRTRRFGFIAPWLVGRPVLLVSATPVVNRMADLVHQLRLGVRDDALSADGIASLHRALMAGEEVTALSRIVVEECGKRGARPDRVAVASPADESECTAVRAAMGRLDRLILSRHSPTAMLVRGVLQRAAGSSPAALLGALRRYRSLLLHARDALASGQSLSRAEIRRFAGELEEQLVLWSLVGGQAGGHDLEPADLDVLETVIDETAGTVTAPDPKLARLDTLLSDGRPTLVFVSNRDTVRHLRDRLGTGSIAWCTGERAGLGACAVPRAVVLGWFRADPQESRCLLHPAPLHLIATDVAAEGLDLQRAARVIHYDQPWTPMRLEQREGRAVRLGSAHSSVDVVRFLAPPILEAALGVERSLTRKALLPAMVGLGPAAARQWRWRAELAERLEAGPAIPGICVVPGGPPGVLAGFSLNVAGGLRRECIAAVVGWLDAEGRWCEEPDLVSRMLAVAARSKELSAPDERRLRNAIRALAPPVRAHLERAGGRRWMALQPQPAVRVVATRLHQAIRDAARRRDVGALQRLEAALAFVAGGHTAGEAELVRRMEGWSGRELASRIGRLPAPSSRPDTIEVRLSGLAIFEG